MLKNLIDVHGSTKLRVNSRGFPSPTHVNNSQHGGKSPTFEPREILKVWLDSLKPNFDYFMQKLIGTCDENVV